MSHVTTTKMVGHFKSLLLWTMLWSSQDISQGGLFITLYSIVNPGVRDFILLVPTPGQYIIPCVSTIY